SDNISALLLPVQSSDGVSIEQTDQWSRIRMGALQNREGMRQLLLKQVAARQGGADTIQAVDATLLIDGIRQLRKSWLLAPDLDLGLFRDHMPIREHLRDLKNLLGNAVESRRALLVQWHHDIVAKLGNEFEMPQITEELRET